LKSTNALLLSESTEDSEDSEDPEGLATVFML
jgi:hypothetical protein